MDENRPQYRARLSDWFGAKRRAYAVFAALAALLLIGGVAVTPASAATITQGWVYISPDPGVWGPISNPITATANGQNVYVYFTTTPRPVLVKWVKCGYLATQDAPSSVGGGTIRVARSGQVTVGTGFRSGTCVMLWARTESRQYDFYRYNVGAYFAR